MAFKWRHWGQMTGKLVCPIGPDTKLEAEPSGHEVEVWGLCVAHLDPDFRMSKLEVSMKCSLCFDSVSKTWASASREPCNCVLPPRK